jgi:hypothetical protein
MGHQLLKHGTRLLDTQPQGSACHSNSKSGSNRFFNHPCKPAPWSGQLSDTDAAGVFGKQSLDVAAPSWRCSGMPGKANALHDAHFHVVKWSAAHLAEAINGGCQAQLGLLRRGAPHLHGQRQVRETLASGHSADLHMALHDSTGCWFEPACMACICSWSLGQKRGVTPPRARCGRTWRQRTSWPGQRGGRCAGGSGIPAQCTTTFAIAEASISWPWNNPNGQC